MANLIQSPEHALPSMCGGQAQVYLDRTIPAIFGEALVASKLWTTVEDDHYYDVYQVVSRDRSRTERFYFDVTPFFGRDTETAYDAWLDLPESQHTYPIWLFFSESDFQAISALGRHGRSADLSDLTVRFDAFSSQDAGGRIATRAENGAGRMRVTAIRSFATTSIPFLHGFLFYRLFMFHQLVHWWQGHAIDTTEVPFDQSPDELRPGRDCVRFTPLAPFDLASDFLNFTFWNHQPSAFDCQAELVAFAETARFGVRSGLFTARELRTSLAEARLDGELKQRLRAAIGVDAPREINEAQSERIAH
jgi:hypothetical protein